MNCRCFSLLEGWIVYAGMETSVLALAVGMFLSPVLMLWSEKRKLRKAEKEWDEIKKQAH